MLSDYVEAPGASHEKLTLAAIFVNWSNVLAANGDHAGAIELTTRGLEIMQPIRELEPNQADVVQRLVSLRGVRAQALMAMGELDRAADDWNEIPSLSPESPLATMCRIQWGLIQARLGRIDAALEVVSQLAGDCSADDRYNLACILSLAAENESLHGAAHSGPLRDQAVDMLVQLAESGYFRHPAQRVLLAEDRDLKALRGYPRFEELSRSATSEIQEP